MCIRDRTYRQEVADHFNELDEDNRRLVVRGDITQWNQMLAEAAHNAWVITNEEFAIFQNAGYMGLYGDVYKRQLLISVGCIYPANYAEQKINEAYDTILRADKVTAEMIPALLSLIHI